MIKSPAKSVNAGLIERYTGVSNYKGRTDQIKCMLKGVNADNYEEMCFRVKSLDTNDSVLGSSNFGKFIDLFESSNADWIDRINEVLEG